MRARISACAMALCVLTIVGGCGSGHPRLTQPGGDPTEAWFGMADGYVKAGGGMTLTNEVNLCADRDVRIEIVEVGLKTVEGDLRVDSYAVRLNGPHYPDSERNDQELWDLGFVEGNVWVDVVCPSPEDLEEALEDGDGRWMHLGIRFVRDSATTARGSTLVISYMAEHSSDVRTLEIPFDIVLCAGPVFDEATGDTFEECDYLRG